VTDTLIALAEQYLAAANMMAEVRGKMIALLTANGADREPVPANPTVARSKPGQTKPKDRAAKAAKPRAEMTATARAVRGASPRSRPGRNDAHSGDRHGDGREGEHGERAPAPVEGQGPRPAGRGRRLANRGDLTDDERDLIGFGGHVAVTRWVLPLASFERKVTHGLAGCRYG
jgi:hypothetical protein